MRALILDENAKADISKVIAYAEAHKVTLAALKDTMEGKRGPVGDNDCHACYLTHGFRVVFSLEEQPCGWCRHLSVSVNSEGKLPSVPAVEILMQEFGFTGGVHDCLNVWVENNMAVNLIQQIEK